MENRIAELAERARSYEQLTESFVADMRIFRHILTSEIVADSDMAYDLLWDLRDSICMDAGNLKHVLSGAYKIVERAAQRAIADALYHEYGV